MSRTSIALLETLTQADAAPGHETEVREIFRSGLAGIGPVATDGLGSVFCTKRGSTDRPRILLASHMDEVGFIVQRVTPAGYIRFHPLGGWWAHSLPAQRVNIITRRGKVPGVIGSRPPHLLKGAERDRVLDVSDLFIDIGAASADEAAGLGVVPGCPIVPHTPFLPLIEDRVYSSKAFDNRVGVALVIEALQRLGEHPNTVIGAGSAQEEVGLRGARTLAELVEPDLAVVLEGPYADDAPGGDPSGMQCRMGGGVHLRLYDPTMIANPALCDHVIEVARGAGIPHQIAVWTAGGTDAGAIHLVGRGIPTIVLGVPVRYIHSHVSVLNIDDYLAVLRLLLVLLPTLDRAAVDRVGHAT